MTNNTISYKGYMARIEFDPRDQIFIGRVLGLADHISFHGTSVAELISDFHAAIENYLEDCSATGRRPEKPASGKVLLRVSPEVHAAAAIAAEAAGKSLNQWAAEALERAANG
ncbi:type II toxin-antitoxin system HicB family antitoxin [Pseudoduganella sp. LjRoot289]|uniref:type II toxin-antitoxin system HicB family antitoxin n=1 Tax=Pseudoduganella sp. LjRoot289 TaxID=3342314 RepID=UPI003ECCB4CC